jgi:predicted RNA-binding Zn-ribbon protein involved in translation (DUF1610 family)
MKTEYHCDKCGAISEETSWSDASYERIDFDSGCIVTEHRHFRVCPKCFSEAITTVIRSEPWIA